MTTAHPSIAVFDAALPPGVATIRSLGGAGATVHAYSHLPYAPGRFSRHVERFDLCPDPVRVDEFTTWLRHEVTVGRISMVAPTSDYVTFAVAQLEDELDRDLSGGVGGERRSAAVHDCLFKDRFAGRLDEVGFPTPPWAVPTTVDEAVEAARRLGYPVVLKPRSHIGVGVPRGVVVHDDAEMRDAFAPFWMGPHVRELAERHPGVELPLVQKMLVGRDIDCVSITGCLARDGSVLASGAIRKVEQWGDALAIGTVFESVAPPPYFEHALATAREVLGTGVFELEVLADRSTGEYWAIDLNPRGFGQMSLDIESGNDLPALWYRSAIGEPAAVPARRRRSPTSWRMGAPFYAGIAVGVALGPQRFEHLRRLLAALSHPAAGAMHSWRDVRPGLAWTVWNLRHPGGLLRPHVLSRRNRPS